MKIWQRIFLAALIVAIISMNTVGFSIIRTQYQNSLDTAVVETTQHLELITEKLRANTIELASDQNMFLIDDLTLTNAILALNGISSYPRYPFYLLANEEHKYDIFEKGVYQYFDGTRIAYQILHAEIGREIGDSLIQNMSYEAPNKLTKSQQYLWITLKVFNYSTEAYTIDLDQPIFNITSDNLVLDTAADIISMSPAGFNDSQRGTGYQYTLEGNEETEFKLGYIIDEKTTTDSPLYYGIGDDTYYSINSYFYLGKLENRTIEPTISEAEHAEDVKKLRKEDYLISADVIPVENLGICISFSDQSYANYAYEELNTKHGFYQTKNEQLLYCTLVSYHLYGRTLTIILQNDVTDIQDNYWAQIKELQITSAIYSALIGVILMILVYWFLFPVKAVRQSVHHIASGNYDTRLPINGHTELTELASDINDMAEKLESNIRQVEEIAENRKLFIDNLAHEMKTPLTSILGFADILSIKPNLSEEERREYSEIIVKETSRLRNLSGKLMELIQIQNHAIELHPLNMKELLEDSIAVQTVLMQEKKLTIEASLQPIVLLGDYDLLQSLVFNLMDNSRKASSPGQSIKVTLKEEGSGIILSIRDHGKGIPKEEISKITQPFYMVDKSRSRKAGGAGLGLALCTEIVKLHHGTLYIKSEPEKGCTTTIRFPKGECV